LGDFDFEANPHINPATIHTLATSAWVRAGQPLCFIGESGTGKSHLLIALGTAAAEAGFRVKYTLETKLVNELVEAADEKVLAKTIARYGRVDLICVDELGYMGIRPSRGRTVVALLTYPWVFVSSWQDGAVAAEGEHGQSDECFGGAESEGDAGQ
jgi:DNA replication protein DnaC